MRHALLLSAVCGLAWSADLTVGTARAHSGQKATGFIEVPAGSDAATNIPVVVVNGAKPGPTVALVAGAHGTEYASIIALEKLAQSADPAHLSGGLIIVPLLNLASFAQKVPHLNPVDGKNMNRFYPGKPDGTQTERASWAITKQVIEKCDYLIDYHGGDLDENLRRYSYWANSGKSDLDATTRAMVLAFGLDHIIIQNFNPDTNPLRAGAPVTITRYASSISKPAIAVEAGHSGTTQAEDIDVLVQGTFSVLRHLKMWPGSVTPVENPLWIPRFTVLTSEKEGVFYSLFGPETYVKQGMVIGYVTDYFGNRIWDAKAPVSGVILYICSLPSMTKGGNVAYIGEVSDAAH